MEFFPVHRSSVCRKNLNWNTTSSFRLWTSTPTGIAPPSIRSTPGIQLWPLYPMPSLWLQLSVPAISWPPIRRPLWAHPRHRALRAEMQLPPHRQALPSPRVAATFTYSTTKPRTGTIRSEWALCTARTCPTYSEPRWWMVSATFHRTTPNRRQLCPKRSWFSGQTLRAPGEFLKRAFWRRKWP